MEEVIIKNEFDRSYMLLKMDLQEENSFLYRMLTQNNISGIVTCKKRFIEDKPYYGYDITSKKTLEKEYADQKMGFQDLRELFFGIHRIMKNANEFLLPTEGFLLKPPYIFKDLETEELYCIYLPSLVHEKREDEKGKYRELADFLLDKTDHKDEHAVNVVYQFYKMSKEEFFSFEAFVGFMEKEALLLQAKERRKEEKKEKVADYREREKCTEDEERERELTEVKEHRYVRRPPNLWIAGVLLSVGMVMTAAYFLIPRLKTWALYLLLPGISLMGMALVLAIYGVYAYYREKKEEEWEEPSEPVTVEEYFDDILDKETVFFDEDTSYRLKWKEGHFSREYQLSEFPITVGKMKESVQLYIEDASISRLHARFKEQGNSIILQDLDSTNGTLVNGRKLAAGEEITIKRDDEIQFGKIIVNVV